MPRSVTTLVGGLGGTGFPAGVAYCSPLGTGGSAFFTDYRANRLRRVAP